MAVSEPSLSEKERLLDQSLRGLGSVLIAYSGGVDSAYLAWRAHQVLETSMRGVIADSPSLARRHLRDALAFAEKHHIPIEVISTRELDNPAYVKNDGLRCFHCKSELFNVMEQTRRRLGYRHLAYGMNLDDRKDFRPGQKAAQEHRVAAPLAEAGLDKNDIRSLARRAGLPLWDKPASPCLSSRLAYGLPVDREALRLIEEGEEFLWSLGLRQYRVRHHGDVARIEIAHDEMPAVFSSGVMKAIAERFKAIGFPYAAIDCAGYQPGSMNVNLPEEILRQGQ
ncbi:MAG TPA: ATP-dependent sacrificial sulfur transferase LarE [Candidatus Methylacidiphilales bacterium]|nr:ATP-dependent sacrificial sulfur transferase LarE [Candidatus Methylacidiphilales bacterium]